MIGRVKLFTSLENIASTTRCRVTNDPLPCNQSTATRSRAPISDRLHVRPRGGQVRLLPAHGEGGGSEVGLSLIDQNFERSGVGGIENRGADADPMRAGG